MVIRKLLGKWHDNNRSENEEKSYNSFPHLSPLLSKLARRSQFSRPLDASSIKQEMSSTCPRLELGVRKMSTTLKTRVPRAREGEVPTTAKDFEKVQSCQFYGYTRQDSVWGNHWPSEKSPGNTRMSLTIQVLCGTKMLLLTYIYLRGRNLVR